MTYAAPIADMRFVLEEVAGSARSRRCPGYEAADRDLVEAVLDEAAKFAAGELAPLNQPADRIGSVLENGVVRTPPGFREAYARYVEGGWGGLAADPDYGGQGLPLALAHAGHRDVELGVHGLCALPAADHRGDRIAAGLWQRRAEAASISAGSSPANGPAR